METTGLSRWSFIPAVLLALAILPLAWTMPVSAAGNTIIREEIVWEGEVFINDTVMIMSNQTLVVRPGATVHIKGVPASCTESNKPLLDINGSIRAEGTADRPISIISGEDMPGCSGREAMVVYTRDQAITSVLTYVRFAGGNLMMSGIAAFFQNCSFEGTFIDIGDDRSIMENCTLNNSPVYFHTAARTVIRDNTIRRGEQDEVGIHLSGGVSVLRNNISGCFFGIEAALGTQARISENVITGCIEGVHSLGNLTITNNTFTGNDVGVNSTAGYDNVKGNIIAQNDVGVVTFGDPSAFLGNAFSPNGTRNRLADIQQKILAQGDVVDGNGLGLRASVTINDTSGNLLFEGNPSYVILTRYERLPDGAEKHHSPFTARSEQAGDSNSTVFDGLYTAGFTIKLGRLLPELSVTKLTGPGTGLEPGDDAVINVTVRNGGKAAAGHFEVAFSVDGRPALSKPVWGLAPGEERTLTFSWTAQEGTHRFSAAADADDRVHETIESDNGLAIRASVERAPHLPAVSAGIMLVLLMILGGAAIRVSKR
jgi:hypothetical protein